MSAFLPAPLTIVVFSLSTTTFLARPSMLRVTFKLQCFGCCPRKKVSMMRMRPPQQADAWNAIELFTLVARAASDRRLHEVIVIAGGEIGFDDFGKVRNV